MPDRAALVVIDVQRGLIEGFEEDWEHVLGVIADQIDRARSAGAPVVLIHHCGSGAAHPLAPGLRAGNCIRPSTLAPRICGCTRRGQTPSSPLTSTLSCSGPP
jgi:nicotinamidase-related amidase